MNNVLNDSLRILNSLGGEFCDYAGQMFVQAGVLIVALLIVDILIRKRVRATFRYWMWMLVFVKLVLPPTLSLPTGIGYWFGGHLANDSPAIVQPSGVTLFNPAPESSPSPIVQAPNEHLTATVSDSPLMVADSPVAPDLNTFTWQGILFCIWIFGVLVITALLDQHIFFVRRLIAQSEPVKNGLVDTLDQCRKQLGLRRNIQLRLSHNVTSPAACGLFRPAILMPKEIIEKLPQEKLRAILIHELAHIKRGDLWINCVQTFLQIVYFYNPLIWLANTIVRRIREQAVDEMALVALGAEARSYSNILIDVAEMAFSRPALSLRFVGVVESKKVLSQRIKHILHRPLPKSAKLGFLGLLVIVVTAAMLLPMAKGNKLDTQTDAGNKLRIERRLHDEISKHLKKTSAEYEELSVVVSSDLSGATCNISGVKELKGVEGNNVWTPIEGSLNIGYVGQGIWKVQGTKQLGHIGFEVDTSDLMADGSIKSATDGAFTATLPNGVTVELVGLCEHPSEGKQWWRPDGEPWANKPYNKFSSHNMAGDKSFELVLRIVSNEKIVWETKSLDQRGSAGWNVLQKEDGLRSEFKNGQFYGGVFHFPSQLPKASVMVGVGLEKNWRTVATQKGNISTSMVNSKNVFLYPALEAGNTTHIDSIYYFPEGKRDAFRLIAIDRKGNQHLIEQGSWAETNEHIYCHKQINLPLNEIIVIHFQTQPLQWVTFRNVSLQPGMKTDVQIEVEDAAAVPQGIPDSPPNIFIMEPSQSTFGIFDKVISLTQDWVWNKTGRQHSEKAYEEIFDGTHNRTPNDVLVLIFSLDREERIPAGYEDLLPKPWAEIETDLTNGRNVELLGKVRGLNVILIAAPGMEQLDKAITTSKFLNNPKSFLKTSGKGCDVGIEDFKINPDPDKMLYYAAASIRNYGKAVSPAFLVSFCRDVPGGAKPTIHGAGPIEPGKTWNERSSSFGLKEGVNEIGVVLDPADMVEESDEGNNRALLKVVVRNGQIVEK